jgi:hypothetical protein
MKTAPGRRIALMAMGLGMAAGAAGLARYMMERRAQPAQRVGFLPLRLRLFSQLLRTVAYSSLRSRRATRSQRSISIACLPKPAG